MTISVEVKSRVPSPSPPLSLWSLSTTISRIEYVSETTKWRVKVGSKGASGHCYFTRMRVSRFFSIYLALAHISLITIIYLLVRKSHFPLFLRVSLFLLILILSRGETFPSVSFIPFVLYLLVHFQLRTT